MYGPWLRAEADAFIVVKDDHYLKRVEILRGEIFDSLQEDLNQDCRNLDTGGTESVEVELTRDYEEEGSVPSEQPGPSRSDEAGNPMASQHVEVRYDTLPKRREGAVDLELAQDSTLRGEVTGTNAESSGPSCEGMDKSGFEHVLGGQAPEEICKPKVGLNVQGPVAKIGSKRKFFSHKSPQ